MAKVILHPIGSSVEETTVPRDYEQNQERMAELNSELAIVIHSEQLAAQAAGMIERDLEPDRAWALELAPRASGGSQIVWRGLRDDRMIRLSREPDATVMQRAIVGVLKFFPSIDRLL